MLSCCSQSLSAHFGWLRSPCRPLQGLGSLRRQNRGERAAVGLQWGRGASLPAPCLCLLCWVSAGSSCLIGEAGGGLNWNLVPAGKVLASAEQESYRDWGERLLKTAPVPEGRAFSLFPCSECLPWVAVCWFWGAWLGRAWAIQALPWSMVVKLQFSICVCEKGEQSVHGTVVPYWCSLNFFPRSEPECWCTG